MSQTEAMQYFNEKNKEFRERRSALHEAYDDNATKPVQWSLCYYCTLCNREVNFWVTMESFTKCCGDKCIEELGLHTEEDKMKHFKNLNDWYYRGLFLEDNGIYKDDQYNLVDPSIVSPCLFFRKTTDKNNTDTMGRFTSA